MKKKDYLFLFVFVVVLILFAILSEKIFFHDVDEYITIAKYFAGINNVDIFSGHSLLYPLIISLFLRIWPSLPTIKLINVLWLFLIGATLLIWLKNKKAFVIFAFSPLVWHMSIQTTPVLPASFFFLLAFIFFKKQNIKYNLFYSGLFLGFSCALYDPILLVSFFFVLVYYWNRILSDTVKYLIFVFLGFIPRMILDYYLFSMPFYSLIRYFGANFIVFLGLNPGTKPLHILSNFWVLLTFIVISPFLFKIYKIKWNIYKKEIIFLGIIGLIFLIRAALLKYFMIIAPIIIILLSYILDKKEVRWHCIISVFLIVLTTHSYFTVDEDILIERDLEKIIQEYDVDYIVAGPFQALGFATFLWGDRPRIAWFQDFEASIENRTSMRGYDFIAKSKIPLRERLRISAYFDRFTNKTYENYILASFKNKPLNFSLEKCYEVLCVYKK